MQRTMRDNRVILAGLAALVVVTGIAAGRPGLAAVPAAVPAAGGSCDAFAKAYQFSGAYGVTPAAWSGHGLTIPACGPIPNDGGARPHVHPYPGALWTPGYQCVELSERYLYYRYGVTMGISTNGDQVAAHYAAAYPTRFMVVPNGTPGRAPVAGDVLSMSKIRGFDGADGGHTAVVQASSVDATGDGTVTIVEENAVASGVEVLPVSGWSVHYDGFPYMEWLTAAGLLVAMPTLAAAQVSRSYSARLTAGGGAGPYHWAVTSGSLPAGLALSASGVLAGTVSAASAGGGDTIRTWPFTVTVTDAKRAVAVAELGLTVTGAPEIFSYAAAAGSLRDARATVTGWDFTTVDGAASALPGHTSDDVGAASSAVESGGRPMVFYSDATTGTLRVAWRSGSRWRFTTLDGPGSTRAGHTGDQVGAVVSAVVVAGEPQVYYLDATSGSVRCAARTAGGWRLETLDGPGSVFPQHTGHHVGSAISALAVDGQPQVYYHDATAGTMHRARWNGTRWLFGTLDGPAAKLAGHTADQVGSAIAATLSGGRPQVFYADTTGQSLRYAWLTASGWRFRTLDGRESKLAGHTADHVGAAIGVTQMNGGAQVYYSDGTRQSLRHAWLTASGWQLETLDGAGSMISGHDTDQDGSALSVTTVAGGPQVFFADATRGSLRLAWWTSAGWNFGTFDGPGPTLPGHTADPVGASVSVTLY